MLCYDGNVICACKVNLRSDSSLEMSFIKIYFKQLLLEWIYTLLKFSWWTKYISTGSYVAFSETWFYEDEAITLYQINLKCDMFSTNLSQTKSQKKLLKITNTFTSYIALQGNWEIVTPYRFLLREYPQKHTNYPSQLSLFMVTFFLPCWKSF